MRKPKELHLIAECNGVISATDENGSIVYYKQRGIGELEQSEIIKFIELGILDKRVLNLDEIPEKNITIAFDGADCIGKLQTRFSRTSGYKIEKITYVMNPNTKQYSVSEAYIVGPKGCKYVVGGETFLSMLTLVLKPDEIAFMRSLNKFDDTLKEMLDFLIRMSGIERTVYYDPTYPKVIGYDRIKSLANYIGGRPVGLGHTADTQRKIVEGFNTIDMKVLRAGAEYVIKKAYGNKKEQIR